MTEYQIRALTSKDLFPLARIIGKIGVGEFRKVFESPDVMDKISEGGDLNAVGLAVVMDVASIIIEHLPDAENEIYLFLASLSGLSRDDLEVMPPADFVGLIVDVVQRPEFKDFSKLAAKFRPTAS